MMLTKENPKYYEKSCPRIHFVHHKPPEHGTVTAKK